MVQKVPTGLNWKRCVKGFHECSTGRYHGTACGRARCRHPLFRGLCRVLGAMCRVGDLVCSVKDVEGVLGMCSFNSVWVEGGHGGRHLAADSVRRLTRRSATMSPRYGLGEGAGVMHADDISGRHDYKLRARGEG